MPAAAEDHDNYSDYWRRFWSAPARSYGSLSSGERDRVDAIASLLPADVETILDTGCGDGAVTNRLHELGHHVIGSDIEADALRHVDVPTRVGSIDALPAQDLEFDCVLAADVLEHLPNGAFEAARSELARVARRYILVNSPNEERLVIAQTQCRHCATAFHSSRHTRAISVADTRDWFDGFELETSRLCGERVRPRNLWLQRIGQLAGHWYVAPAAVCPNCGYPADTRRASLLVRLPFAAAHRVLGFFAKPRPTEFVALYRRSAL